MYTGTQFNEKVKQISFFLIIVFLFCLIVGELKYFASSVLGGFTLYVMLRKPHRYLLKKGWNNTLSASLLLIITFAFLTLAVGGLVSLIYGKLSYFQPTSILNSLRHIQNLIMQEWGYNIFSEEIIQKALSTIGNIVPAILSASGNVLANVVMMIFVLFFMLQQSKQFEAALGEFIPISKESIQLIKAETHIMTLSNAVGIPLIMIGQAVSAGVAYWLLGAGDPIIWGIITGFVGLIPVLGTGGVWLPLSINLLAGGNIWQGIVLLVYGALIIASVDSLVRIVFLKKKANVHPLITLFGVVLGMNVFGFWGIIFGPLIISGFFLLLKIYKHEFSSKKL